MATTLSRENLAVFSLGYVIKRLGNQPFGADYYKRNQSKTFGQNGHGWIAQRLHSAGEHGYHEHHGNDGDILEDQDAQRGPSVEAVELLSLLNYAQDYCGAAQGYQESQQKTASPIGSLKFAIIAKTAATVRKTCMIPPLRHTS